MYRQASGETITGIRRTVNGIRIIGPFCLHSCIPSPHSSARYMNSHLSNKQMREWTRLCSVKKLYDNREAIVSWPWGGRFCVTRSQHPLLHFFQAKMAPFHLNLPPSTQKPIWNFFFSRNQWVWSRNMSTRCCRNVYFSPHFSIVLLSLCQYKVLFHSAYLSQCPSGGKFTHRKFVFGSNGRDPQAKAAMSQSWTKLPREI